MSPQRRQTMGSGSAAATAAGTAKRAGGPTRSSAPVSPHRSASSRCCRFSISRSSGRLRPRTPPPAAAMAPRAASQRGSRPGPAAPLPQQPGGRHLTGSDGSRQGPTWSEREADTAALERGIGRNLRGTGGGGTGSHPEGRESVPPRTSKITSGVCFPWAQASVAPGSGCLTLRVIPTSQNPSCRN